MKFAKGDAIAGHHRFPRGLDVASARVYIVLAIGEGLLYAFVSIQRPDQSSFPGTMAQLRHRGMAPEDASAK